MNYANHRADSFGVREQKGEALPAHRPGVPNM
jgi:hypothetical protein